MSNNYQTIKRRQTVVWAVISVFYVLVFTSNIFACECVPLKSLADELSNSELVFTGKVVHINSPKSTKISGNIGVFIEGKEITGISLTAPTSIKFRIIQNLKGTISTRYVTITTFSGCCDCGFTFQKNTEYLVYAYKNDEGRLETSVCTRTKLKSQAEEDLKQIQIESLPTKNGSK